MPLKKFTLKTTEADRGKRLDQVLSDWLPGAASTELSKGKIRKLIVAGAVYLNGKRLRIASKNILPNAKIDAFVDFEKLAAAGPGKDRPFEMKPCDILFEDQYIIVVNKPAGLPTQPTLDESRDNLFAVLKSYIAKRDGVVDPYVGLHHRLDRDTSGVILLTKDRQVNRAVADLFSERQAQKTYLALTAKPKAWDKKTWSIKNHLGRAVGSGKKARFGAVRSGGDFAHTDFEVLEEVGAGLVIQASPRTGRTHQIRVHLSEAGRHSLRWFRRTSRKSHASRLAPSV